MEEKEMKIITKLEEQARQDMTDLYRDYRRSVIHMNYEGQTATLSTDGVDEKALIFGSTFQTLKSLLNGEQKCTVKEAFKRMKAAIK